MQRPNLDDIARRPAQYWMIDGLPELMLGVLWIVWGAAWLAGERLPHAWPWKAYWLIVPPALAMSGLAVNAMTRALKRRVTFPRAGYVEWDQPARRTTYGIGAAIVVAPYWRWRRLEPVDRISSRGPPPCSRSSSRCRSSP